MRYFVQITALGENVWMRRNRQTCKHSNEIFEIILPSGYLMVQFASNGRAQYKDASEQWMWADEELNTILVRARKEIDREECVSKAAEKNARKYAAVAAYKARDGGQK